MSTDKFICQHCGHEDTGDSWFDRSLCSCNTMHQRCAECNEPLDPCEDNDQQIKETTMNTLPLPDISGWFPVPPKVTIPPWTPCAQKTVNGIIHVYEKGLDYPHVVMEGGLSTYYSKVKLPIIPVPTMPSVEDIPEDVLIQAAKNIYAEDFAGTWEDGLAISHQTCITDVQLAYEPLAEFVFNQTLNASINYAFEHIESTGEELGYTPEEIEAFKTAILEGFAQSENLTT